MYWGRQAWFSEWDTLGRFTRAALVFQTFVIAPVVIAVSIAFAVLADSRHRWLPVVGAVFGVVWLVAQYVSYRKLLQERREDF